MIKQVKWTNGGSIIIVMINNSIKDFCYSYTTYNSDKGQGQDSIENWMKRVKEAFERGTTITNTTVSMSMDTYDKMLEIANSFTELKEL